MIVLGFDPFWIVAVIGFLEAYRKWKYNLWATSHDRHWLKIYSDKSFDQMRHTTFRQEQQALEEWQDPSGEMGVRPCFVGCLIGDFNREFIITVGSKDPQARVFRLAAETGHPFERLDFFSMYRLDSTRDVKRYKLTFKPNATYERELATRMTQQGTDGIEHLLNKAPA